MLGVVCTYSQVRKEETTSLSSYDYILMHVLILTGAYIFLTNKFQDLRQRKLKTATKMPQNQFSLIALFGYQK